ncbi:MAG: SHOCT domain-containing protein [Desulfobacteraceae bacterium]|nr:SHOCT domain-containing protein [Desulfobacteraceae bacterium]
MKAKKKDKEGIFKSLFAAYFVILLHVFLLAGTGITVVLFRGVYHYLPWIMGGLAVLILVLFWIFYMKMKKSSRDMKEILSFPEFRGRTVEVKLLGGMATFTVKGGEGYDATPLIGQDGFHGNGGPLRLAAPEEGIEQRLAELAKLYEEELITKDEFDTAKKRILFD